MSEAIKLFPLSAFFQGLMLQIVSPIIIAVSKMTNKDGVAIFFITEIVNYLVIIIR
jgi:hypothetical protein